jgi:hypothetical protein
MNHTVESVTQPSQVNDVAEPSHAKKQIELTRQSVFIQIGTRVSGGG